MMINTEFLNALELNVLSVQRTTAGSWWNYRHVISPFSRLWLVLGGEATVVHGGRQFKLSRGQIHLVPAFAAHDCFCRHQFDHYHLHFAARLPTGIDLFSALDFECQLDAPTDALGHFRRLEKIYPERKLPCFDPNQDEYKSYPLKKEPLLAAGSTLDDFEAKGHLILLVARYLKAARQHEAIHSRVNNQFLAVQKYIHSNMDSDIKLTHMAKVARLHPTYFSDNFKRIVGIRPLEYLMRRRIERAQYLLLTSSHSVKEIAASVGIPDSNYFSRVFSSISRISPSVYRATHSVK